LKTEYSVAQRKAFDARRRAAKPWRAWYNSARWLATRLAQLRAHPLCWLCLKRGIRTIATICNHSERHNGDPVKFWAGPFDSMCKGCHDSDQQRIENGGLARQVIGPDGWPVDLTGRGGSIPTKLRPLDRIGSKTLKKPD
jgi:5-methylcytosine-specific restriction protein A